MAGAGSLPKEQRSRSRDSAARLANTARLSADDILRGPDLPAGEWHERTVAWWETLRRSPMSQAWIPADWDNLIDTALLHTRYWEGDLKLAAEIRLRVAQFGTSPEARLRLRMQVIDEAPAAQEAKPPIAADRRRRLLKAVGDGS